MIDLNFKYKEAAQIFLNSAPFTPDIAIILGSGLGSFAETLDIVKVLSNDELPGYPAATVAGHSGKIYFSEYMGKKVVLFKGRIHFYETNKITECILPVFFSHISGCRYLLLTNAAGGVNPLYTPGNLMMATSFNGILLKKELTSLIGISDLETKINFNDFPSSDFNHKIIDAAKDSDIDLKQGVYWYTKGPSYETPAEIKMIAKYGGDAVGMSTVHEAVLGTYYRMKTSAISCITNYASGISDEKLSHLDVTKTARLVEEKFGTLVRGVINKIK